MSSYAHAGILPAGQTLRRIGAPRPVSRFRGGISRRLASYVATKRIRARNTRPLVSFTFDDVPDTAFINGARILEEHGARGTFYIAGGLCGTIDANRRLISAADCVQLHRRGHEIGCHTFTHPVIQWLDADSFTTELDRNRDFFARLVPNLVLENFCYPYGIASLPRKFQAQTRFDSCRSAKAGINVGTIDLGMVHGTPIDHTASATSIIEAIDETVRRNGWLVLFTHDVSPDPTWIGCTPQFLGAAIEAARERGCEIATVRDALRRIGA